MADREALPNDLLETLLRRTWSDPVSVTTPATAGTVFAVQHGLGFTPSQFLVAHKNAACDVYAAKSPAWTASTAYLAATAGSVALKIAFR